MTTSSAARAPIRSAGEAVSTAAGWLLRQLMRPEAAFYLAAVGLYLLLRMGSFVYTPVRVTDTPTYEQVSNASLFSGAFWTGRRPFTVPLLWKLASDDHARIVAQLTLSIVGWLALAAAVAACIRQRVIARVAVVLVLLFSATTEIILWDPLLLSESVSLSLTALLLAAWLAFVRSPTWVGVAGVLGITLLWTFARDSHAYVALLTALVVLGSLAQRAHRPLKAALAAGSIVVFVLAVASANDGLRWYQPMRDILLNRVAVDPKMQIYFQDRLGPNWRELDARRVYAKYLLTHPGYTLGDPFYGTQTTPFSSTDSASSLLDPDFRIYNDNAADRALPLPRAVGGLVYPQGKGTVFTLLLVIVFAAAAVAFRFGVSPPWVVPTVALVSTAPHGLIAYHLSGLEVDRHALEVAVLLRVGILLLAVFAVDSAVTALRAKDRLGERS